MNEIDLILPKTADGILPDANMTIYFLSDDEAEWGSGTLYAWTRDLYIIDGHDDRWTVSASECFAYEKNVKNAAAKIRDKS